MEWTIYYLRINTKEFLNCVMQKINIVKDWLWNFIHDTDKFL